MSHEHNIVDSGNAFIIDAVTRMISKPKDIPRVVQGDHNCERIRFELNALVIEGHDMSKSDRCEIHFTNFNPETDDKFEGVYIVDDLACSDGKVVFSWRIQEDATQLWGALGFSIKFLCFAEDGTQSYEWNSLTSGGIPVFPGKDNTKNVIEKYPNIYESLLFDIDKTKRMAESMKYYGSADIVPSDTSLFSFVTDDTTMTATISAKEEKTITGDVVIPYKYDVGDKTYVVTAIGKEAFASDPVYDDYEGITSIIIPNTVTAIGDQAFYASEALESVAIPDSVTSIGRSAFYWCTLLKEIVLPKKLKKINYGAFACCRSLNKVIIPDGVTTIEDMAFMGCNLSEMYLPKSLQSFDISGYGSAPEVENVYYDGTEEEYNAIDMRTLEGAVIHYNYLPKAFSCIRIKSPNGTIYKLTVADDGTLKIDSINGI